MNTTLTYARMCERTLVQRFTQLIGNDRANTAQLLVAIAEIDQRKLWAKQAFPSMFAFCMERFHMSESVTAKRIWAARTARRFPALLPMVAKGEIHLSGINRLSKYLTKENHLEVLSRAKHKSSRELEVLIAELAPRPDVASRVRALPRAKTKALAAKREEPQRRVEAHAPSEAKRHGVVPARKQVVPLSPRRYKVEVTVDEETHEALCALRDLLSQSDSGADPAQIVSRAIKLLLSETLKKKAAMTENRPRRCCADKPAKKPAGQQPVKRTRAIPAAIRREVWKRDLGRCAYVDTKGRRCRATRHIEYHHGHPYGQGGEHAVENIALRCRAHNQYQADLDYGRMFMDAKRGGGGERSARNVG